MKKLTYPLTGAFAIATCALLVACGGGGGGGGGTPATNPPSTATPVATPTLAPQAVTATPAASTTGTTLVNLGGVSNGTANVITSASVTLPKVSGASNATIVLSATVPNGVAVPSARNMRGRFTLGVANTPVAYFQLTMSSTVTITMTPAFTVVLPSNVTVSTGNAYLVVLPGSGTWQEVAGPITAANTMTFQSTSVGSSSFTLTAGTTYTFAIVTTGTLTLNTPAPTTSPSTSPSTSPTSSASAVPAADPTLAADTGTPTTLGWSPYQVATALKFPIQNNGGNLGFNGSGQTVAIVGDYAPTASDVTTYLSGLHITSAGNPFTVVAVDGGQTTDTTSQAEATLDIETVAGLAPGAKIVFYEMPDLNGGSFVDAYTKIATDTTNNPSVLSISYGGCEGAYDLTVTDPVLAQVAAKGIATFASSGDYGNECFTGTTPQYAPGLNAPASDPNVIAVGGQENFPVSGTCPAAPSGTPTLLSTAVWNDCFFTGGQGASGGGVSAQFTPPPYQSGLSTNGASSAGRNVPDIAMPAENVGIYLTNNGSSGWSLYGGTSWSAPLAAAQAAELNEYCGGTFIASAGASPVARYYTAYSRSPADFIDIVSGNNQYAGSTPSYNAGTGYDLVSGLGVPYGMSVAASLCPTPSNHPSIVRRAPAHTPFAEALDGYGEARDTSLGYVPHIGTDMGERGAASTRIVLVLRATPTIASDESAVIADLQQAGFTIVGRYPNHMVIDATAPASTVGRYFQTSIHNINQGAHGMRYANTAPVVLPASIARVTHGAIVDNLVIARWFHHRIVPLGKN